MGMKILKDGEAFSFPKDFGFRESAEGPKNPRNHPAVMQDEMTDGTYVGKAKGGSVKCYAKGGKVLKRAVGGPTVIGAGPSGPMPMPGQAPPQGMAMPVPGQPPAAGVGRPAPAQAGMAGALSNANISMPVMDASNLMKRSFMAGHQVGQQGNVARGMVGKGPSAVPQRRPLGGPPGALMSPVAAPPPSVPAMAKGGKFIQKAVKHPGRETARAASAGRSVHAQMEHDKHSKNPSLRGAANLGLRLTGGDLSPRKRKG